jgi:hypothetical protein
MKSKKSLNSAIVLFSLNLCSYVMLTWDFRAVAQANYIQSPIINMVIGILGFSIFKKIQEADTMIERVFYILSCGVGVDVGIWVSKVFLGQ